MPMEGVDVVFVSSLFLLNTSQKGVQKYNIILVLTINSTVSSKN